MTSIREHKRHYNKPDQEFECERLFQDPDLVVLRYVAASPYRMSHKYVAAGSSTLGVYRRGARWVFWKMLDPAGRLDAYMIHLCEPIELQPDRVVYRDLMLDIWQEPPANPILLDEDDLEAALKAGQVDAGTGGQIQEAARDLLTRFDSLVAEMENLLAALPGI